MSASPPPGCACRKSLSARSLSPSPRVGAGSNACHRGMHRHRQFGNSRIAGNELAAMNRSDRFQAMESAASAGRRAGRHAREHALGTTLGFSPLVTASGSRYRYAPCAGDRLAFELPCLLANVGNQTQERECRRHEVEDCYEQHAAQYRQERLRVLLEVDL